MKRRDVLKAGVGAASVAAWSRSIEAAEAAKPLRVGLIGAGWYGKTDLFHLMQVAPVEVVGLCDVDQRMLEEAAKLVTEEKFSLPESDRRQHCRQRHWGTG